MNVSLYEAAAGMNAHSKWQEMVAENLANSSIPGSRRQEISFSSVQAGLAAGLIGSPSVIPMASSSTNFRQGDLTPTDAPTDFAIDGPGFFEVRMPNGSLAYTRNGKLQADSQGQLRTQTGLVILGDNGPILVDRSSLEPIKLSNTGELTQGGTTLGRPRLVEFNNPKWLTPVEGGSYVSTDPRLVANRARASQLHQGLIENSNVSPVTEMASLVTAMRMFEANQRVLQIQDERMGKTILELSGQS